MTNLEKWEVFNKENSIVTAEDCFDCKQCCGFDEEFTKYAPLLTKSEYNNLLWRTKIKIKVPVTKFKGNYQLYLELSDDEKSYWKCPLLNEKHKCIAYKCRPLECAIYPMEIIKVKGKIIFALDHCPAVERVTEKVRRRYFEKAREFLEKEIIKNYIFRDIQDISEYEDYIYVE